MALPVEILDFFSFMRGFWMLLPLVIRQVFYFSLFVTAVFAVMSFYRGGSND